MVQDFKAVELSVAVPPAAEVNFCEGSTFECEVTDGPNVPPAPKPPGCGTGNTLGMTFENCETFVSCGANPQPGSQAYKSQYEHTIGILQEQLAAALN